MSETTLPPGWIICALGDVRVDRGSRVVPSDTPDELFELFSIPSFPSGQAEVVPGATIGSDKQSVEPGTVLVSKINPRINRVWHVRPRTAHRLIASTEWVPFFPVEAVEPQYLAYYLRQDDFREYLASNVSGVGGSLMRVRPVVVERYSLRLPPLAEQRRIVAVLEEHLSELDAAVAALERTQANLARYRASVLRSACLGELGNHRTTASDVSLDGAETRTLCRAGRSVAPDELLTGQLPLGWQLVSLDALASRITSGSRDWSRFYGSGTGTFIMAQNVRPGKLDLTFRQAVNPPPDDRDRDRSQVRQNDVLITIVGANTGDVCIVPTELPEHFVCQSVALVRPHVPEVGRWLAMYLASPENGQRQFEKYMYGQGRPHLSFDQLRMVPIPVPPLSVQREILAEVERRTSTVDRASADIHAQLARAARLRQSILKAAFEGKLVPQDPTDEPAAVLLDRIHAEHVTTVSVPRARAKTTSTSRTSRR